MSRVKTIENRSARITPQKINPEFSGKIWPFRRSTIKSPRKKNIFQEKILPIMQNSLNIAPSSFCVYLFGLGSLAAPVRDFYFWCIFASEMQREQSPMRRDGVAATACFIYQIWKFTSASWHLQVRSARMGKRPRSTPWLQNTTQS